MPFAVHSKSWLAVTVVVAVAAGWAGRDLLGGVVDAVTTIPPREPSPKVGALEPQDSTVAANILVPYDAITDALAQAAPKEIPISDDPKFCVDVAEQIARTVRTKTGLDNFVKWVLKKTFIWTNVRYCDRLKVTGKVSIATDKLITAPVGSQLMRVSIPVYVKGDIGLRGDLARLAKADSKTITGAINAFADVGLQLDEKWCPKVTFKPGFSWVEKAKLEVVERAWIDVSELAERAMKDELEELAKTVQEKIDCNAVRAGVAQQWGVHRVLVPSKTKPGYADAEIAFQPVGAGLHGITMTSQGASLAVSIDGKVAVTLADSELEGGSPAGKLEAGDAVKVLQPASIELPPLKKLSTTTENKTRLAVVLRAPYDVASNKLAEMLLNRKFEGDTPVGRAFASISSIEVYPTKGKLAIRVGVEAGLKRWWHMLSFKGDMYLTTTPHVDPTSQVLTVKSPSFYGVIDNDMYQALAAILKAPIEKAIAEVSYDLKPELKQAVDHLNEAVATENESSQKQAGKKHDAYFLAVAVQSPNLAIGRIGTGAQAFEVEGLVDATISLGFIEVNEKSEVAAAPPDAPLGLPVFSNVMRAVVVNTASSNGPAPVVRFPSGSSVTVR